MSGFDYSISIIAGYKYMHKYNRLGVSNCKLHFDFAPDSANSVVIVKLVLLNVRLSTSYGKREGTEMSN